jgi:glucose dehydrogenase
MKIHHITVGGWLLVAVGIVMVVATSVKLLNFVEVDSDWYWFIAGLGFIVQGVLMSVKNKHFTKNYKILKRESQE